MLKPFTVADQLYDAEAITSHREDMIRLRDTALEAGLMDWAVALSHNVAILAHVAKEMQDA